MKHENKNKGRSYSDVDTFQTRGGYEMPPTQQTVPVVQEKARPRISFVEVILFLVMLGMIAWGYTSRKEDKETQMLLIEQLKQLERSNKLLQGQVMTKEEVEKVVNEKVVRVLAEKEETYSDTGQNQKRLVATRKEVKKMPIVTSLASDTKTETDKIDKKERSYEKIKTERAGVGFYEKPNETSKKITMLPKRAELELIEEAKAKGQEGFLKVKYKEKMGYVYYYKTTYTKTRKTEYKKEVELYATLNLGCELREAPGITSDRLTCLKTGDKLKITRYEEFIHGEIYGWYFVEVLNTNWKGWIYGNADKDVEVEIFLDNENVDDTGNVKVASAVKGSALSGASSSALSEASSSALSEASSSALSGASSSALSEASSSVLSEASSSAPEEVDDSEATSLVSRLIEKIEWTHVKEDKKELIKGKGKKETIKKGVVIGQSVNLRNKPTTIKSKVKDCLAKGEKVRINCRKGNWYKVKLMSGKTGYMHSNYVRLYRSVDDLEALKGTEVREEEDSKLSKKEFARRECKNFNWGDSQFKCLDQLWEKESGWDPNCVYNNCYGIPQMKATAHILPKGYKENWKIQIKTGLKYIKGRYGSPANAWAHFCQHNWY